MEFEVYYHFVQFFSEMVGLFVYLAMKIKCQVNLQLSFSFNKIECTSG